MISDQMKSLTQNIEASYEARIAAVSALAQETHSSLGSFQQQRKEMARGLKRSLATNKAQRLQQVKHMRDEHARSFQMMSKALAAALATANQQRAASENERRREFAAVIGKIRDMVTDLNTETAETLAYFRLEHDEMARTLKASLAEETKDRSKETHEMLAHFAHEHEEMAAALRSDLASFQTKLSETVDGMLTEFSTDHKQARASWENLTKALNAKRAN